MIDYTIAKKLHDQLMERHAFSEYHSLGSYDAAVEVAHAAGLATALVPLAKSDIRRGVTPKMELHLALIDPVEPRIPGVHPGFSLEHDESRPATLVYSLSLLRPATDYLGELVEANLTNPWWAVDGFFSGITRAVVNTIYATGLEGGRSHWGHQRRSAFHEAFEERWLAGGEPAALELAPAVEIPRKRVRFTTTRVNNPPTFIAA